MIYMAWTPWITRNDFTDILWYIWCELYGLLAVSSSINSAVKYFIKIQHVFLNMIFFLDSQINISVPSVIITTNLLISFFYNWKVKQIYNIRTLSEIYNLFVRALETGRKVSLCRAFLTCFAASAHNFYI